MVKDLEEDDAFRAKIQQEREAYGDESGSLDPFTFANEPVKCTFLGFHFY